MRAAARLRDRVADLQRVIDRDGLTYMASNGAWRVQAAAVEQRQIELVITRLLKTMPDHKW